MDITSEILDIEQYEAKKHLPATLVERTHSSEYWLIRDMPLGSVSDPSKEWGWCNTGEVVRIPLFPYLSHSSSAAVALAYAFQLGVEARDMIDHNYEIVRIHIVAGEPVQEIAGLIKEQPGTSVLRFWLGFGCLLKEKKHE